MADPTDRTESDAATQLRLVRVLYGHWRHAVDLARIRGGLVFTARAELLEYVLERTLGLVDPDSVRARALEGVLASDDQWASSFRDLAEGRGEPRCICGADHTGENPVENPACPRDGITPAALDWQESRVSYSEEAPF